jgi:L-ascorbate metabolism protein UlaG (beta-lactamase superfamily)
MFSRNLQMLNYGRRNMFAGFVIIAALFALAVPARGSGDCLAMAEAPARLQVVNFVPAALETDQVQLTFVGHSTFLIETPGGVIIATDYAGYAGGVVPDVVTMNRAHPTHYTNSPDSRIKHVLRGWNPAGGPARHDLQIADVRIRNVTTDIRGGYAGRVPDGNSIFVFDVAGLCIGHLGHLHHELTPAHVGWIGRLDIVLVPVDGGYTMAQVNMFNVVKELRARVVIPMHYFGPSTLARFIANARGSFEVENAASPVVIFSAETLPAKPTLLLLPGN